MKRVSISALAGLALAVAGANAATVNETVPQDTILQARSDLQDDTTANSSDRIIVGGTSTNSDYTRPILRWTLSTVPSGEFATTNGTVTLTAYPYTDQSSADGKVVDVYAIKPANAGWIESDATWNHLSVSSSTPWSGGAGLGNPGDGYDATPLDTFTFTGQSTIDVTIPQALLNDWISNPADNAGIIMDMRDLDGTERFLRFWSNNGDAPAVLSFETAPVPEPGTLSVLVLSAGALVIGRRRR